MITILKTIKQKSPMILLSVILAVCVFLSFRLVSASSGFVTNDDVWYNLEDDLPDKGKTYPYDTDTANIKKVDLGTAYGTSRGLAMYHGEIPHLETHDSSDTEKPVDEYQGLPYMEGTCLYVTPNDKDSFDSKYWGLFGSDDLFNTVANNNGKIARADLEQVNSNGTISLRLYALSHTHSTSGFFASIGYALGRFIYFLLRLIAQLVMFFISLLIDMKNINANTLLEKMNLEKISDILNQSFISNGQVGSSPITVFAILCFMFTLTAQVIRWVKGSTKTRAIWTDVVLTAFIGFLVIFMSLSGRFWSVGESLGHFVTNIMYAIAAPDNDSNQAFQVDIDDPEHENKIIAMKEMALVNKAFMDLQICVQFSANGIEDLNFDKLNLDDIEAKKHLFVGNADAGYSEDMSLYEWAKKYAESNGDLSTNNNNTEELNAIDNNLGYYFWFANSPAVELVKYNTEIPEASLTKSEFKLQWMMTALQVAYNKGTATEKLNIERVVKALSVNGGITGAFTMLLFIIVLCMMFYCLLGYALRVLINEIMMFLSLLGMALAGPLILSTNKKLVGYGKSIIGLVAMSIIKITVFAAVFDMILFVVASIISPDPLTLLIVVGLLALLCRFAKVIVEKLDRFLDDVVMRKVAPELRQTMAQAKNALNRRKDGIGNRLQNYGRNKGGVLGEAANRAGNLMNSSRSQSRLQHKSLGSRIEDNINKKKRDKLNQKAASFEEAKKKNDDVMNAIKEENDNLENQFKEMAEDIKNSIYTVGEDGERVYDDENMTMEEIQLRDDAEEQKHISDAITKDDRYKELRKKQREGNLTEEEQVELSKMDEQLNNADKTKKEINKNLDALIKNHVEIETRKSMNINAKGNIHELLAKKAQEKHMNELKSSIEDVKAFAENEATTRRNEFGKITQDKSKNYEALKVQMQADQQLSALAKGELINNSVKSEQLTEDRKLAYDNITTQDSMKAFRKDNAKAREDFVSQSLATERTQQIQTNIVKKENELKNNKSLSAEEKKQLKEELKEERRNLADAQKDDAQIIKQTEKHVARDARSDGKANNISYQASHYEQVRTDDVTPQSKNNALGETVRNNTNQNRNMNSTPQSNNVAPNNGEPQKVKLNMSNVKMNTSSPEAQAVERTVEKTTVERVVERPQNNQQSTNRYDTPQPNNNSQSNNRGYYNTPQQNNSGYNSNPQPNNRGNYDTPQQNNSGYTNNNANNNANNRGYTERPNNNPQPRQNSAPQRNNYEPPMQEYSKPEQSYSEPRYNNSGRTTTQNTTQNNAKQNDEALNAFITRNRPKDTEKPRGVRDDLRAQDYSKPDISPEYNGSVTHETLINGKPYNKDTNDGSGSRPNGGKRKR